MSTTNYPTGISKTSDGYWLVRAQKVDAKTGRLLWRKKKLPPSASLGDAVLTREELLQMAAGASPPKAPTMTVGEYARSWLQRKIPWLESKNTQLRYAEALVLHIDPVIGDVRLHMLTKADLELWFAHCRKGNRHEFRDRARVKRGLPPLNLKPAPYSAHTINGWWRVLKEMVQAAVAEFALPVDPTMKVEPLPLVKKLKSKRNTLTDDQLTALFDYCFTHKPQWYAFMVLGFSIGARPGELRPLRWKEDVDLEGGMVLLQRSQRGEHLGTTKTKEEREIPLPQLLVDVLKWHKDYLFRSGHPGAKSGLVFPAWGTWRPWHKKAPTKEQRTTKSEFMSKSAFDKPLAEMCEAIGVDIEITPKAMRRRFNSATLDRVDPLVIQSITGHSSDAMRGRYSHVTTETKRGVIASVLTMRLPHPLQGQVEGQVGGHSEALSGHVRHTQKGVSD